MSRGVKDRRGCCNNGGGGGGSNGKGVGSSGGDDDKGDVGVPDDEVRDSGGVYGGGDYDDAR